MARNVKLPSYNIDTGIGNVNITSDLAEAAIRGIDRIVSSDVTKDVAKAGANIAKDMFTSAGKVLSSDTTKNIFKAGANATKDILNNTSKLIDGDAAKKAFSTGADIGKELFKGTGKVVTGELGKNAFNIGTSIGKGIINDFSNINGGLGTSITDIYKRRYKYGTDRNIDLSSAFSGIKDLLSGVTEHIGKIDNSVVKMDLQSAVDFSSNLRFSESLISESFNNWAGLFKTLKENRSLLGAYLPTSEEALNKMNYTYTRFGEYLHVMAERLPNLANALRDKDISFISLDDNFNLAKTIGASSMAAVAGATATLDSKKEVENWSRANGVYNKRYGECLGWAVARAGFEKSGAGTASEAPAAFKAKGYEVNGIPKEKAILIVGNHAMYVEKYNSNGTIRVSEANYGGDFNVRDIQPPAGGVYISKPGSTASSFFSGLGNINLGDFDLGNIKIDKAISIFDDIASLFK